MKKFKISGTQDLRSRLGTYSLEFGTYPKLRKLKGCQMATFTTEGEALTFRMLPELLRSLNLEIALINAERKIEFNGRVLSKEIILNAVALDFLSLPEQERRDILTNAIANLENLLLDRKEASGKPEDLARFKAPGLKSSKRKPKKSQKKIG